MGRRASAVVVAGVSLGVAFGIRAVFGGRLDNTGALQQDSGTALYASAVYAAVVFLRPRIPPLVAGAWALGFCWAVEALQLTSVPRTLSEYSIVLRLMLGRAFDWTDVWWYPVGIVPLVAAEVWRASGGRDHAGPQQRHQDAAEGGAVVDERGDRVAGDEA
ncbi:DUF2809 domain-containing protein [Dactylosporangium sp. CA-092794]|uniref:ribosomal maturation YjgA family protein n=1 Tax=Dactylosporangium sp. CA-092794 TaxID=3239929 RepID=UPI003D94007D